MAAFDAAPLRNGSGPADAVCTLLLGSNQSCMGSGTDELGGGVGGNDMPPMTSAPQGMGWHGLLPMWLSSAASSLLNSFMQHGTSQNTAANSWPTAQLETSCISPRHHSSPMGNDSHSFHAACVGTHGITPSSSPAGQGASSSSAFGLPAALFHVSHTAVLALLLVCVSYVVETAYYKGLVWLERKGVIERLAPHIKPTQTSYLKQTAVTFFLSAWFVLLIARAPPVWARLMASARPRWDALEIAVTCWVGVALHDFWFWALHSICHKVKPLYRAVHVGHHKSEGGLTVFGTADMHPLEAMALVFGFYAAALVSYAYVLGSWNPVSYYALVLLEANMNMMGHCGYRQPAWLALLQSGGVWLTPGVAHAQTHYIHHLDPRMNRALYFTWWDRAGGTFSDKHAHIKELSPAEHWEYEIRVFRMGAGWVKQRVAGLKAWAKAKGSV